MPTIEDSTSSLQTPTVGKAFRDQRGMRFGGCLHQMRTDPLGLYTRTWREYGDYVRLRIVPHIHCFVLTHPDAIEHVLLKGHKNYRKPDIFYKSVSLLIGNGLFTNEGESWIHQRRLAQPAFHSQYLAQLGSVMVAGAQAFVREQEQVGRGGQPIDMVDAMMQVGLRIASTTLFSSDISGDTDAIGRAFRTGFVHVSNRLNSSQMIPNWLPTPANIKFARAKRLLDRAVWEIIEARRKSSDQPKDLLSMLLNARDENSGAEMPRQQLMDEVLTLLTAGHETIGAALSWTWYLLGLHPEIQENVFDEIHARLQGRSVSVDDLPHLPLTTAVFEESLRLYPPGWGELRQTIAADEINGYAIGSREIIILCQWVTHRHPDFWDEPDKFKPERFLGTAAENRHRFAYFPFGGGPRICIGMQFAMMEGPLVLATILQRFRVELVAGQNVVPDATFTLRPRHAMKMVLHPRGATVS